jgi:hypothetical protein
MAVPQRIPVGWDPVASAIENAPTLDERERAELEASVWVRLPAGSADAAEEWRREAAAQLAELAAVDDPARAAASSQLLTAQAALLEHVTRVAADERLNQLPRHLRPAARALAVSAYLRALQLAADPEGTFSGDAGEGLA